MKRIFDLITTFFGLFLLLPVIIITTLILIRKLGSPIFFIQSRPGLNKKIFNIYKFRTMTDERDIDGALLPDEVRLTKLGKFLRSTSLDELPSLWNVLRGDMSFVGPRPALYNQDDLIALRAEKGVDKLLPGITGWAQVNGRDELSIPAKVVLDVEYLKRQSFWFDMKILWMTFIKVVKRDGVSH